MEIYSSVFSPQSLSCVGLAIQSSVCVLAQPGSWLEMQNLKLLPNFLIRICILTRLSQVICMHIKV